MSDDLEQVNLMSKAEAFLNFLIFTELQLMERCSKAISWKACINPKELSFGDDYVQDLNFLANNVMNSKLEDKLNFYRVTINGRMLKSNFLEDLNKSKRT